MADASIKNLTKQIADFCNQRDWNKFHNAKDMALSLTLEAAEVLEHFQWKNEKEIQAYLKTNNTDIAEELADVMYWVLRMADRFDIDIIEAFNKKMQKNAKKYPVEAAKGNHKKYNEL